MQAIQIMKKRKIFKVFSFLIASIALECSEINYQFKVPIKNDSLWSANSLASIQANKIIRDHAYLSIQNNSKLADCWKKFLINKKIIFKHNGSRLNPIRSNKRFIYYELIFDTSSIIVPDIIKQEFLNSCQG